MIRSPEDKSALHKPQGSWLEPGSNAHARIRVHSVATGKQAIGALALGALAIGAMAIGALAIGRLVVGRARIHRLEIDELEVGTLRVTDKLDLPDTRRNDR